MVVESECCKQLIFSSLTGGHSRCSEELQAEEHQQPQQPAAAAPGTVACPGRPEDPEGDTAGGCSPAVSWPMLLPLVVWRKSQFLQGPVHLAGKLESWGVIGAIHPGKLVHVKDNISGASFLVDTGSSYSILPYSSSLQPTGPLLKSAGGQRIPC